MENKEIIKVLNLAVMELETAYKRLGYTNSNVMRSMVEMIDDLEREELSQATVMGSGFDDDQFDDEPEPCPTCGEIDGMVNQCCAGYDPLHFKNCGYG